MPIRALASVETLGFYPREGWLVPCLVFLLPALVRIALRVADLAGAGPGSVGVGLGWLWATVLAAAAAIIALVVYRMLSRS